VVPRFTSWTAKQNIERKMLFRRAGVMSLCQQCGQEYCDIGFCFQVNNPEDSVDCVTQWGTTFGAASKLSQPSSSNTSGLWTIMQADKGADGGPGH
jgi:hypothetical protein